MWPEIIRARASNKWPHGFFFNYFSILHWSCKTVVLQLQHALESPGSLLKHRLLDPILKDSMSLGLGKRTRISISIRFPKWGWFYCFREHTLRITGLDCHDTLENLGSKFWFKKFLFSNLDFGKIKICLCFRFCLWPKWSKLLNTQEYQLNDNWLCKILSDVEPY